jgi:hypothetical protein
MHKTFTNGEMTSFECQGCKEPGQEAIPQCKWQARSDKHIYGRTKMQ